MNLGLDQLNEQWPFDCERLTLAAMHAIGSVACTFPFCYQQVLLPCRRYNVMISNPISATPFRRLSSSAEYTPFCLVCTFATIKFNITLTTIYALRGAHPSTYESLCARLCFFLNARLFVFFLFVCLMLFQMVWLI